MRLHSLASVAASHASAGPDGLSPAVAAALWRGDQLGGAPAPVLATGFAALDAELPGGGWPCRALTELLQPQPSVIEWRLLGPALARVAAGGGSVVLVGPPKPPHPPGLARAGLDARRLVWVCAETPAERLWCVEQLLGAGDCGAVVAWLPQARPEQIRRLQLAAQGCDGPVFACRPAAAQHEASAAPLRLHAACGEDWQLQVRLLKRRGPTHDGVLELRSLPGGLDAVLAPPLAGGSTMVPLLSCLGDSLPETADAVGGAVARSHAGRRSAAH